MTSPSNTPYVYRITDTITGKIYIGSRYAKGCHPSDLGETYFTSSKTVKPIYKSEPSRFSKAILVTGDVDYVRRVERSLLKMYNCVLSDKYYNRHDTEIGHPEDCAKGGRHAVESGQLASFRTKEHQINAGKKGGRASVASGHLKRVASSGGKAGSLAHLVSGHIKNLGLVQGKISGRLVMKMRVRCVECGMISTPASIGRHQKFSGHSGKEKL